MRYTAIGTAIAEVSLRSRVCGLALVFAACVATPPTSETTSITAAPTPSAPAATTTPVAATSGPIRSPASSLGDLTVSAAGAICGDHLLVLEITTARTAGVPSKVRILYLPLDGGAPRVLVSYTTGPQTLTGNDVFTFARQLSADGARLVLSDPAGAAGTGVVIVDLVAGTARSIQTKVAALQPAWSPDGGRIAFEGTEPAGPFRKDAGVWVVSATGGDERQVRASAIPAGSGMGSVHGWTEDGTRVIFWQPDDGLSAVDVATGGVTKVGGAVVGIAPVAIRARRPSMAVVVDETVARGPVAGRVDVRENAAASARTVARYGPDEGTFLNEPRWRPGSDEILLFYAFGQGLQLRKELVIVDAVSGRRRGIPTPQGVRAATWTADGRRIAYSDLFEVRIVDADGSNDRPVYRPVAPAPDHDVFVMRLAAFPPG